MTTVIDLFAGLGGWSTGVRLNHERLFLVITSSRAPLFIDFPTRVHVPTASFIDFNTGRWPSVDKQGRAPATLARVARGRQQHGERFVMPYYKSGSGLTGRSLQRPIGTITTRDRWAVVDDRMRMLTANEILRAMSFPADTKHPDNHRLTVHMADNAVPPLAGAEIIKALRAAA